MTMLERVAAKIAERGGSSWDDCLKAPGQKMANMYRGMARAAIEALMEPTEGMLYRGEGMTDFILPDGFENSKQSRMQEFKYGFREALKAALEEGK